MSYNLAISEFQFRQNLVALWLVKVYIYDKDKHKFQGQGHLCSWSRTQCHLQLCRNIAHLFLFQKIYTFTNLFL